jgi:hypothetical protein
MNREEKMDSRSAKFWLACGGVLSVAIFTCAVRAAPPETAAAVTKREPERVSVEEARQRARLMHRIYLATLDAMHHHYFHANKAVLPARAMEDVFADVARETDSKARWIAVNTQAMSVEHEPATEFEKKAAAELAKGSPEVTIVEGGYYRRAGSVPLSGGCIGCHTGNSATAAAVPRYAGLVISIPVGDE